MKKIIFTRLDGSLSVYSPAADAQFAGESEEAFHARLCERIEKKFLGSNMRVVDETAIPTDRTFRDAWTLNGAGIAVDMPKAREIRREQLRTLRKPKMEALDVAYMRADEMGDTAEKQRIAALKAALRNVTADPAIEAATTPAELKAALPAALK